MSLKRIRTEQGLSQREVAERAGVSRQLVSSIEAGRHLPRVDAALALAEALGVEVGDLFRTEPHPVDVLTGEPSLDGFVVRCGVVGDTTVTAPLGIGADGWDVPDGTVDGHSFTSFGARTPGLVVAGCEPGLATLEGMLRERSIAALAVPTSSAAAIESLQAGRVHAAVVHGPRNRLRPPPEDVDVEIFRMGSWNVGLAGPAESAKDWWRDALTGRRAVAQREAGAGVQATFESALDPDVSPVEGPRVKTHLDAARRAVFGGLAAVTIEPAALAVGASFHPLDVHDLQLWIDRRWLGTRVVTDAMTVLLSDRFRKRLEWVGGYDLSSIGMRVA